MNRVFFILELIMGSVDKLQVLARTSEGMQQIHCVWHEFTSRAALQGVHPMVWIMQSFLFHLPALVEMPTFNANQISQNTLLDDLMRFDYRRVEHMVMHHT